ncbi:MAG: iron-sulfur cluster-binding protein [Chloroflexi bacterium]|nr:iron-sulfur cluster-binding protein [Chloroflexota bacterium]
MAPVQVRTQEFPRASSRALANGRVQQALTNVMGHFDHAREAAIQELTPEVWERYRERGREIKRHAMEYLDFYLELLSERVEANGGKVHFARTAQEATQIVLEIAKALGVKVAVKGKSMLSEEMGLNHALEEQGIAPVETDLGEYIIQLAQEPPFHILAPAMHKTKEEVGELFAAKLGLGGLQQIPDMAAAARKTLRERFLQADMGITGVNFAVAETGTVVIVTNEGNGRMCTSLPRVHVALMGMEKVVPALEDLSVMLRLLPRAATGQRITSYVTLVSGPRQPGDEDGPEEFHLVIVDAGRTRLLADPELREALYCIRCGACLNTCPVYRKVGGHAYGWVYPGPIGSVITPVMVGLPRARDLPFASSLCGACREVCPLKINIPLMLVSLRRRLMEGAPGERGVSWGQRLLVRLWSRVVASEGSLRRARRLAAVFQRPFLRRRVVRWIPFPPFSRWTRNRDMPGLARRSFHELWDRDLKTTGRSKRP